jgi:hypothetical protein
LTAPTCGFTLQSLAGGSHMAQVARRFPVPVLWPLLLVLGLLVACMQAPFDQGALLRAENLRAQSLALIAVAGDPYAGRAADAAALLAAVQAERDAAAQAEGNETVVQQWDTILAADGPYLGGVLARWQAAGTLGEVFRTEAAARVAAAFDALIDTEKAKQQKG